MNTITVDIKIKSEHLAAFKQEIARHIAATKAGESGCVQFDFSVDTEDPERFYLYEVYADDDALEAHHHSPSLAQYRETSKDWAVHRNVRRGVLRDPLE